jgi:hypothetical protein
MYNIIHLASSPGLRDTARRARPVAQPAGASHFTLIMGGGEAPPRRRRGVREAVPPSRPSPSSG